ncbi:MAG TPA: type II toxin-antitoxin system RelE/ParE family toxin [candidate division Zixibacteria bacterium]|nr:type II toxin-antitoxin system RelE/ParE family toxin [candidate division Zixibacteria bacterium]
MSNSNARGREYTIYFLPVAEKELEKLPKQIKKQILEVIHSLKFPFQVPAIKMRNTNDTYRTKVGDYRIIYKIYNAEVIVVVIRIAHRKKAYR